MSGRSTVVESRSIVPLEGEDLPSLRLKWGSRFSLQEVAALVREAPGLSLWVPSSGEYVLAGPW
ncbi:MAG: N-acetyltransferase, partial [Thermomicrobium sp.]|nr:N-acetyltransferase [Thermomicrobium sp.]